MEVGKTYRYKQINYFYECLHIGKERVFLRNIASGDEFIVSYQEAKDYIEHREPRSVTVYINIAQSACDKIFAHDKLFQTREIAEAYGRSCIGYLRTVEFKYTEKL
jgi:hypothetical protein